MLNISSALSDQQTVLIYKSLNNVTVYASSKRSVGSRIVACTCREDVYHIHEELHAPGQREGRYVKKENCLLIRVSDVSLIDWLDKDVVVFLGDLPLNPDLESLEFRWIEAMNKLYK